ncbi:hypothetical protein A9Q99_23530 [Gammaproteobacteria bacterium 45_16_T64]|nr:hypothetical protein A9Q99_23530 [Gammaproteobacteria bacterium 45_16_T64]
MSFMDDFRAGIRYPFADSEWLRKLWPLPLIAAIPILGVVSLLILKGWRFQMVKQMVGGSTELPEFDLWVMLKRGALLWVVMIAHIFIPGVLCAILGLGGPLSLIADLYQIIDEGFSSWAKSAPTDWALTIFIYVMWGVISFPVYQSGMIRYALTGNWKSMLNAPANFLVFLRFSHWFAKFYVSWLLLSLVILAVDSVLVFTGVGVLVIPTFTVCAYYVTSAYELGHLAKRLHSSEVVVNEGRPIDIGQV